MHNLTSAVLIAQAFGSLLVGVLLGLLHRTYKRPFLLYWSYSWAALAIYTASGVVAIPLAEAVAASHPARLIQSFISIYAALQAAAWLLFGTFALSRAREITRRAVLQCGFGVAAVAAVVTIATLPLPGPLRYVVRISVPEVVLALALTAAAVRVWRVPTRPRAAGRLVLTIALKLYGLEQLRYAVDVIADYFFRSRYPDLTALGFADFFIQATIALALVIWLLEDESDRLETSLRQEGHALDALLQSEARQRTVLDNIDEVVYIVNHPADRTRRSLEFVGPRVEEMFGYRPEDLAGDSKNWLAMVHPDDVGALKDRTRAIFASGDPGTREYRARHKLTGELRWIEDRIVPNRDASGHVTAIFGVARDVTERKLAEQALRESEAQARQAQKMEAVGRLAGGIAHDFNNLVMAINAHTEILLDMFGPADDRRREVQEIGKAAARAADLTRQLLAFSRKESIKLRALDVNDVVGGLERMLRRLIPDNVNLTTALDPGIGSVWADRGQFEQVIVNLVVNARDALPGGGEIQIMTRDVAGASVDASSLVSGALADGPYVELVVRDNGSGIDPELRSHIFEPFFTTKESDKGTGLGLSIVYSIVRQSGGSVALESGAGGTTFRLYFPRGEAVTDRTAAVPSTGSGAGTGVVLVVDEEDAVRGLVARVLRRHGFDVVEARGRSDAMRALGADAGSVARTIDLAIIDCVSLEDSVALACELRVAQPALRVLYFAASDNEAGTAAAEPRLRKPFMPDTLVRVVAQALSGKSTTTP